jgi:phosphatidylserine/phosphatidylglycerophosphate/cardiolipin synthase-like enzyme
MDVEVVVDQPWQHILRAIRRQEGRTVAAIAYVTKSLLDLSRGDVLVCDASELSVKTAQTNPKVLLSYLRKGVSVWSHPGLHAKAIVRGRVAVVGSANSSGASADGYLSELVAILRSRPAVTGIRQRIELLARRSVALDPVTLGRLARLFKPGREFRPIRKPPGGRRTRAKTRAWCIGTHYTDEHADVEKARQRGTRHAEKSAQSLFGQAMEAIVSYRQ